MGDERPHVAESDPSGIDIPSLMPPSTPSLDQIYRIADCRSGQGPMGARRDAALIRPRRLGVSLWTVGARREPVR